MTGHKPERVITTAKVHLKEDGGGFVIRQIELDMEELVLGMDESDAEVANTNCPVSKALAGPEITLNARFAT